MVRVVPCPPEQVLSRDDKKSHEMPWLQDETSLGMLNTSTWVAGVDMESVLNEMESYLPPPPSCSQSMSSEGTCIAATAAEGGAEARLIIDAQIKQEQEDVDGMCSVEDMPMSPPISEIPTLPSDFRPQPMHRKAAKHYVPKEQKDDKYWAKRAKNNLAAKRSRDTRRIKENHIILRASFLEEECFLDPFEVNFKVFELAGAMKALNETVWPFVYAFFMTLVQIIIISFNSFSPASLELFLPLLVNLVDDVDDVFRKVSICNTPNPRQGARLFEQLAKNSCSVQANKIKVIVFRQYFN
ncbi:unnamed protein product [Darwinula stevensoni]|uniref:BZIP domain-containing protein n=1 Tax=Darwinula stevensoni TaxID=69355 RepID=A0A7R9FNN3_9CRUS|nr:unnamed protein product [Darwinula stevensoni]CAG0896948.1 unnamed protein product [Darwinula stevensoni]